MAAAMKGICKGFNKYISQIFVVKEREIEIGYPTDVKHVAHIGWDGATGTAPSWMTEFKTGPEFSAPAVGSVAAVAEQRGGSCSTHGVGGGSTHGIGGGSISTSGSCKWPHQDCGSMGRQVKQPVLDTYKDTSEAEISCVPKKHRRRKTKTSSPKQSSSSTRTHRTGKSKTKFAEMETTPNLQDL